MAVLANPVGTSSWIHRDREATRWANYGLAFCLGVVAASAYDRVPDLWNKGAKLEHVEKVEVPQLKHRLVVEKGKQEKVCRAVAENGDVGTILDAKDCLNPH